MQTLAQALTGQYDIERELGRGGMGVVYLARDLKLQRLVAIKVLPPELADQPAVRERFLREARIAAQLSHPHIVPVHRADEIDGVAFFVMGYVDGESLGQRVKRDGPLAAADAVRLLRDAASALGYAHTRGIVHRDVKPENILLDRLSGNAMLSDFGVARIAAASPLTASGMVLGTVHYMSPEQSTDDAIDGRSDLYSLGVVGFLALSGMLPFDGATAAAVLVAHHTRPAPKLATVAPKLSPILCEIIDRCLAKRPDDRWANGDVLARALADVPADVVAATHVTTTDDGAARMVSESDAAWVWKRAAALQASAKDTAALPAIPAPLPALGTPADGYRLNYVAAAAEEAGISRQHVALALDELRGARGGVTQVGATPGGVALVDAAGRVPIQRDASTHNKLAGAATRLEFETVLDLEVPGDAFEELAQVIRHRMQEIGTVATFGKSLIWSVDSQRRRAEVSVIPRNGRTTIRITEDMGQMLRQNFGGFMGGIGGGAGFAMLGSVMAATNNPLLGGLTLAGVVGGSYLLARGVYGNSSRKRERRMRALHDDLVSAIQQMASDANRKRLK